MSKYVRDWDELSPYEKFRAKPLPEREAILAKLSPEEKARRNYEWINGFARPKQLPPKINPKTGKPDWLVWMLRAGRGFGKTRTGAGWVHARAMEGGATRWIALIARTPADARDVMILGPGGIMKNTPPDERPDYIPSNRALIWPNGARATIYSDEVPDQLRGFSGDTAWIDELAKFAHPMETWDNLTFGMRELSADMPRTLITTTPRPLPVIKLIESLPDTVVVVGSSYENENNLSPKYYESLMRYAGTRLGRQEIEAEIVDDLPGALWTRKLLEDCRLPLGAKLPEFKRVVVGVDPSGVSDGEQGNSVGIVCVALGVDGIGYVLRDNTTTGLGPAQWAKRVIATATEYEADRIVAEKNFGGAMVEFTIRTADQNAPIKMVTASRGKVIRAEPVAALYEQGKIKHVGSFPEMEDQMCLFMPEGYADEDSSPDRADAMVWAVTDLMLKKPWMREQIETGLPVSY